MQKSEDKAKCLYILQMTKLKLNKDSMKKLKCLLFEVINRTKTEHIVLEIFFDSEFLPLEE
jgi:hypothetical protein